MRVNGNSARLAGAVLTACLIASPARSQPIALLPPTYTGSSNAGIVFGVANYGGGPNNGAPTYIPNNITGRTDILTSPAGGFQTANLSVANNIASYGPATFTPAQYMYAAQSGGGNGNGPFGVAQVVNNGNAVGDTQADSPLATTSASYSITSWTASYTAATNVPAGNSYGNYIAMRGTLPGASSATAMALRTFISSPNAGDPFFGGVDLPQLVLAYAGSGNFQALGGTNGTAAAIIANGLSFRGLAINSLALGGAIGAGDTINVTSTLTVITDPAGGDTYVPDFTGADADLYTLEGSTPLPFFDSVAPQAVPEPGTLALLGVAGAGMAAWRRKKKLAA